MVPSSGFAPAFEDLQYQLTMHNSELGELFFVTQFLRGLKPEIGNVVQSQIPDTLERAMLLARIQQQVIEKGKTKWTKPSTSYKATAPALKNDSKGNGQLSPCGKKDKPGTT